MKRKFAFTTTEPYGKKGAFDLMAGLVGPQDALVNFIGLHYSGFTVVGMRDCPTKEDVDGRLLRWWRAEAISPGNEFAVVVWIREQIGGFDVPELTLKDLEK